MQTKLLTAGVVVVILGGLTYFNYTYNQPRLTPAQEAEMAEMAENIEKLANVDETEAVEETESPAPAESEDETGDAIRQAVGIEDTGKSLWETVEVIEEWPAELPEPCLMQLELSNGNVMIQVHKDWAPVGATHFYELAKIRFFNDSVFYRVVPDFMVQVGIAADPVIDEQWAEQTIQDEAVKQSNKPGMISFAQKQTPNSRSTSFFISTRDNAYLDRMGFAPFAIVVDGMEHIRSINSEYGETPDQFRGHTQGNAYFKAEFPNLDYIKTIKLLTRK